MANLISQTNYRIIGKDLNASELFPFETFNPNTETIKEFVERQKGETLVMIQKYDDNFEYAVINLSNNIEYNSQLTTDIAHFERRLKNGVWTAWNSRDLATINLNSFPNGSKIITDRRLFLNLETHVIYDENLNKWNIYDKGDEILRVERENFTLIGELVKTQDGIVFPINGSGENGIIKKGDIWITGNESLRALVDNPTEPQDWLLSDDLSLFIDHKYSNEPKEYEATLKPNFINFYNFQLYAGIGHTMQSSVIQNVQTRIFE